MRKLNKMSQMRTGFIKTNKFSRVGQTIVCRPYPHPVLFLIFPIDPMSSAPEWERRTVRHYIDRWRRHHDTLGQATDVNVSWYESGLVWFSRVANILKHAASVGQAKCLSAICDLLQ